MASHRALCDRGSDTLIRKGDAKPLKMSRFELDLFSLPLILILHQDEALARLANRLPQHGGLPRGDVAENIGKA
jgi:hypothetical protein